MRALLRDPGPTLTDFLTAWHGPPDRPAQRCERNGLAPEPLVEWFEVTSRWTKPVTVMNHLVVLERLMSEAGLVTFWLENQHVWAWAYQLGEPDPLVFDRRNTPSAEWTSTGYRLTTFLVRIAVFEAILSAENAVSAAWVERDQRDAVLAPLDALPGPEWNWPPGGSRLYAGDGLLASCGVNATDHQAAEETAWTIFLAAREPARLAYLADLPGVDWVQVPQ